MCYVSVKGQVRVIPSLGIGIPNFESLIQNGSGNESKTQI